MVQIVQNSSLDKFAALDGILTSAYKEAGTPSNNCETTSLKIGDIKINIRSSFHPYKNLYDSLFAIASTKLKETPAYEVS